MALIDTSTIIRETAPPLDSVLMGQLLSEYSSQETRYFLRDWEPATLDGGQFAEAAARLLYHQDSEILDRLKSVDGCLKYVEDPNNQNTHHFPERKSALHLCRVLRTIYKFRSDRGAVHINPDYSANQLDSRLVIDNSRWVLSELLRVFWSGDRQLVAKAIREILQYEIPVVGKYEDQLIVQRVDCSAEEEILLLLHVSGETGFGRQELGRFVRKTPGRITQAIQSLEADRHVIRLESGRYRLTDMGVARVIHELAEKLLLA